MTQAIFQGTGGLDAALANGKRLLSSNPRAAEEQAREILQINPTNRQAGRLLAAALRRTGREVEAEQVELQAVNLFASQPALAQAADAIARQDLGEAERLLRPYLKQEPEDVAALVMLAEVDTMVEAYDEAGALLGEALRLTPSFVDAHLSLSTVLFRQNRVPESLAALDRILARDPTCVPAVDAKGTTLSYIGQYEEAASLYEQLLDRVPTAESTWINHANLLKTMGRLDEAIAAYRRALALNPSSGDAYWSLANLKTVKLGEEDLAEVKRVLADPNLRAEDRLQLHFTSGKVLEDLGRFEDSFAHYAEGNRIKHMLLPHDPKLVKEETDRSIHFFTADLFARHQGQGSDSAEPIFIVGMPRAGSTLLEQILSSHSMVEGTSELPYIPALVRKLIADRWKSMPELLADLQADEILALGEEYLDRARPHRKSDRPYFIDKLHNNWVDVGFIKLILPNARIIDARRHPMACGFSNFKQYFAQGQSFSYSLQDIGSYYSDYVRLMAHFDKVMPGMVHRVIYESLIEDPTHEVTRLLSHIGLPFEEQCLRFHENARAVRTASSEQVRQPINRKGLDQWKPYEAWLEPLKSALGPVLIAYPPAPSI